MANIDWDELERQVEMQRALRKSKNYAPNGEYTVKLDHVEIKDKDSWKSPALTFYWKETAEYKFPRSATHWLSIPKPNYRQVHNLNILMQFGIEKPKAKELIEGAERDQDRLKLIKGYEALYQRLAGREVETTITVRDQYDREGKLVKSPNGTPYSESDFKAWEARVTNAPKEQPTEAATDEEIDLGDIPF